MLLAPENVKLNTNKKERPENIKKKVEINRKNGKHSIEVKIDKSGSEKREMDQKKKKREREYNSE